MSCLSFLLFYDTRKGGRTNLADHFSQIIKECSACLLIPYLWMACAKLLFWELAQCRVEWGDIVHSVSCKLADSLDFFLLRCAIVVGPEVKLK